MTVPDLIPVVHEPHYRTNTIGRYADGQFLANIHCVDTEWFVYLHLFDADGRHRRSDITPIGAAPYLVGELRDRAEARLAQLLDGLPDLRFDDVAIRTFQVVAHGVTFGLIDESDPERGDWVELHPDWLGFGPPWDGEYST